MDTYVPRTPSAAFLVRLGNVLFDGAAMLRALAERLDAWLAVRKRVADDLEALIRMSERELHDIGISRASIDAIAIDAWARDVPDRSTLRQNDPG